MFASASGRFTPQASAQSGACAARLRCSAVASVPNERRGTPQPFEGCADLVVGDHPVAHVVQIVLDVEEPRDVRCRIG